MVGYVNVQVPKVLDLSWLYGMGLETLRFFKKTKTNALKRNGTSQGFSETLRT